MKRLSLLCLALAWTLPVAGYSSTNQPPAAATRKPPAQLTVAQHREIIDLLKQFKEAFDAKNYLLAKEKVNALLKIQPGSEAHWYNLACAQSRLG